MYFGRDGATLVLLLTGGTTQRPSRDIAVAKDLWADCQQRRAPGRLREAGITVLTRSFKDSVRNRIADDPAFAAALLRESVETMLAGDVDTGKSVLRDYIKATIGFEKLGAAIGTQPKSLIRMFGLRGNPRARNLFGVIG